MKSLFLITIFTAGMTYLCFKHFQPSPPPPPPPQSESVTTITSINDIGELSLIKIYYGACLNTDKVVKVYTAEAFIGIDLTNSKMEKVNDKKYVIHLPVPELQKDSITLIEKESNIVAYKGYKMFYREHKEWKSEAINDFTQKINGNSEYIESAKEQASQLFKAIFESQGFIIEIKWNQPENRNKQ